MHKNTATLTDTATIIVVESSSSPCEPSVLGHSAGRYSVEDGTKWVTNGFCECTEGLCGVVVAGQPPKGLTKCGPEGADDGGWCGDTVHTDDGNMMGSVAGMVVVVVVVVVGLVVVVLGL